MLKQISWIIFCIIVSLLLCYVHSLCSTNYGKAASLFGSILWLILAYDEVKILYRDYVD